ncbi:hypothetical protein GCM10025777_07670 [Membranihabitans marinus]
MWISLCASALYGQGVEIRNFIFGHSLIDHRPPKIETPSDETTVPHWIGKLAQQGGHQYAAGGQYGFLPQHAQLPPMSQWGYDEVPGLWDSDIESFAQANINTILMTAGNFMQWQDPDLDYPTDPGVSPISATQDIVDWVENQSDSIHFYIYENWPDMAGYLNNGFPPSESEWLAYDEYTNGSFHDWWIKYHDALLESRSASSIFMIPVGPIIHRIRKEILKDDVAFTSLYEDDAPHGRANLYFLAGLVSYMAIYEEKPVLDFNFSDIIHPVIQQNYEAIIGLAWSALLDFKTDDGKSRVFKSDVLSSETPVTFKDEIDIFPNPSRDIVYIQSKYNGLKLDIYDVTGRLILRREYSKNTIELKVSNWPQGMYFVKIKDEKGQHRGFKKFLVIH